MVSVIIPTYNREKTIMKSLQSVLEQTFTDIEVIIVDDGSTDNTKQIIKSINDDRIRYIYQDNKGACSARNRGIKEARGEYIAFQDSDDKWQRNKIEIQLSALQHNQADICFCRFTKHGYSEVEGQISPIIRSGTIKYWDLIRNSVVSTQTILAKKCVFQKYMFDSHIKRLQDYDWTIRVGKECVFYLCDSPLVDVYLQDDSITNKTKYMDALESLLHKYEKSDNKEIVAILTNKIANLKSIEGQRTYRAYFKAFSLCGKMEFAIKGVLSFCGILPFLLRYKTKRE